MVSNKFDCRGAPLLVFFACYVSKSLKKEKLASSMASNAINIRWIRFGSQPYCKIMYIIVFQTIFNECLDKIMSLKPVLLAQAFGSSSRANKTVFDLINFNFDIIGKI